MFAHLPLLSLLIWLPIVGAVIVLLVGNDKKPNRARTVALITSTVSLLLCIPLYADFNTSTYAMQFVENFVWIPAYDIHYHLGVDGISMPLIILTTFTTLIVVLHAWNSICKNVAQYLASFLIMQGMMVGMFASVDSILFYVFWEAMLIPIYLSIGMWGGENRSYASIKFFIFTFAGSALMLIVLLYLHYLSGSFNILSFYDLKLTMSQQVFIFLAFFAAFAVKVPMVPVHTWLPDAHTEAPAGGSVVLAALMLKMGVYGFLRFSIPIAPNASQHLDWLIIILSLVAIVYIGIAAIMQKDMKRLIAYSSIAHMGFATLGIFMLYQIVKNTHNMTDAFMSLEGSMVQMISHAFSTGAMFVGVGILYDRLHSRMIKDYGGVANKMPVFAALFLLFALSNVGMPGTSGFVGEFMILLSTFRADFWVAFFAASTLILAATYTLWMYKRVFFGAVGNEQVETLTDISGLDKLAFALLAVMVLLIGIYPESLLRVLHATIGHLLILAHTSKLPIA